MHLYVMQYSTCIYAAANATGASNFIHYFNQYENAISSIKHLIRFYPSTRMKLSPSLFNSNLITIAEKGALVQDLSIELKYSSSYLTQGQYHNSFIHFDCWSGHLVSIVAT